MAERKKRDIVASLLDLPEFEPERARVRLPRLGIELELREVAYDRLVRIRRESDATVHLILASVTNHPELRQEAWYHDKMGCATPVDAMKKLLRAGEMDRVVRVIDRLQGYGPGSVLLEEDAGLEDAATAAAVEELETN